MHPRVCVNPYGLGLGLAQLLDFARAEKVANLGISTMLLAEGRWEENVRRVGDAGVPIGYVLHPNMFTLDDPRAWPVERDALRRSVAAAAALGARTVYTTTGPAGRLSWEEAAAALAEAVAPVLADAGPTSTGICFELTNSLRQDVNFVYTLRDAVTLSDITGLGINVDYQWCWREAGLDETIRAAAPRTMLVQVSDAVPTITSMPDRVVPGDGVIPHRRIIGGLLAAGYSGLFDLELVGPRIDREGPAAAMLRGAAYLSNLLEDLEA